MGGASLRGSTVDLSLAGAAIELDEVDQTAVRFGLPARALLHLPGRAAPVAVPGELRWWQTTGEPGRMRIGIQFGSPGVQVVWELRRFLDSLR
jgi:hypothetical protein